MLLNYLRSVPNERATWSNDRHIELEQPIQNLPRGCVLVANKQPRNTSSQASYYWFWVQQASSWHKERLQKKGIESVWFDASSLAPHLGLLGKLYISKLWKLFVLNLTFIQNHRCTQSRLLHLFFFVLTIADLDGAIPETWKNWGGLLCTNAIDNAID